MTQRIPVTTVGMVDWSDVGPLQTTRLDDGSLVTHKPAAKWRVLAETTDGAVYVFHKAWPIMSDVGVIVSLVSRVMCEGTIDPEKWEFLRNRYGSPAYLAECENMTPEQLAGEE